MTTDTAQLVLWEVDDNGVLTLTLNRPERNNGWTPALEHRYFELLDAAAADTSVRAIVLTGAGSAFCPGMDAQRIDSEAGKPLDLSNRRPFHRPLDVPKPMIAAINGACAGIGLLQAMMCDIRFASSKARMSTSFARRGLPAERGMSWLLPRLIGVENALDLLLSGRTFDATEAKSIGVVSRLSAPESVLSDAKDYARMLAGQCSPTAMAVIRRQVYTDLSSGLSDAYGRAMVGLDHLAVGSDFREGIDSYLQKRKPAFPPLPSDFTADSVLTR